MKKVLFVTLVALCAFSCVGNLSKKASSAETKTESCCEAETKTESCCEAETKTESSCEAETKTESCCEAEKCYTVSEIIENGAELVGKEVNIQGRITHTCKHSGRRCFIVGKDNLDLSIRVEAGGKISGFNRELAGCDVIINGVVMEQRITQEQLAKQVEMLSAQQEESGEAEHCGTELANINSIIAELKAEGKDYYSIYYINGIDYKEVESAK